MSTNLPTEQNATEGGPCENTDKHLWPQISRFDAPQESIHATADGRIGINVAGCVYVKSLRQWHDLAGGTEAFSIDNRPSKTRVYGPRTTYAHAAFLAHFGRAHDPNSLSDDRWIVGYIAALEDLPRSALAEIGLR